MKEIISKDNPKVKEWEKLKQKKYVEKYNKVILEGIRLINEAEARGIKFEAVLTSFFTTEEFNCPVYKLLDKVYNLLSSTKSSQGVLAIACVDSPRFELPTGNFLVLDSIRDPGNLGTIIRTAVACGFKEIYALDSVDFRNEKVLRSTMGTIFDAKVMKISFDDFKKLEKYNLICADMGGKSVFSIQKPSGQFGIIVGNEAQGISQDILEKVNLKVSLPMKNNVESLNVAVACGILMYLLG